MFYTFFYQPILNLLIWLYNVIPGHDLGLAILALTIVIKLILYPLSKKSLESQKDLQDLQPKINELKKKYANNKEEMSKALLNVYRDNKVNPFSSCLPLLLQLPILIAVFHVFRNGFSSEVLNGVYSFIHRPDSINSMSLGLMDLSKSSRVLAVLAGLAQFWQAKMMMTKKPEISAPESKDEDVAAMVNKQMLYMMPALTVLIGFGLPGALSLYWLLTTLLSVAQQYYIFKNKSGKNNPTEVLEGEIVSK